MKTRSRQILIRASVAVAACALFASVLAWQHYAARARYGTFMAGDPHIGAHVFQRKGCAHCHSVGGAGGRIAPDLGFEFRPKSSINQLVTAMWNHAPRMWERMRAERVGYPSLDREETAHLFAFLYTTRYVDEPGDPDNGRALFQSKGCIRCHGISGQGGKIGPDLTAVSGVDTPIWWTETMWNHAPAMEAGMRQVGLSWPVFEGQEMNDLLAYIRQVNSSPRRESELLPADPAAGRKVFREKSCITCHAVRGEGGRLGPDLDPKGGRTLTLVQFAGRMWNHSPNMWRAMAERGVPRPTFKGRQMADLIAFLYSLRYFEPAGSPEAGKTLFEKRGCARCHGPVGQGTSFAPQVRGRGLTTLTFAEALWRHGPAMYERMKTMSQPWPTLEETDVGDLVAFLNRTNVEGR